MSGNRHGWRKPSLAGSFVHSVIIPATLGTMKKQLVATIGIGIAVALLCGVGFIAGYFYHNLNVQSSDAQTPKAIDYDALATKYGGTSTPATKCSVTLTAEEFHAAFSDTIVQATKTDGYDFSKDQVEAIITSAPSGTTPVDIVAMILAHGCRIEGYPNVTSSQSYPVGQAPWELGSAAANTTAFTQDQLINYMVNLPPVESNQTVVDLGNAIKARYPAYSDMDSAELGRKVMAKYPQYSNYADVGVAVTQKPSSTSSVWGLGHVALDIIVCLTLLIVAFGVSLYTKRHKTTSSVLQKHLPWRLFLVLYWLIGFVIMLVSALVGGYYDDLPSKLLLVANYLLGGYVAMSVLLMLISAGVRFIAFGGKPTDHN